MNWITPYYQDALAFELGFFHLDFWFEPLIYWLAALCICALAYRRPGKKRLGVALGVAIVFALVDPLAYQPLVAFESLPERIRTLSGDTLAFMVFWVLGGATLLLGAIKRTRTFERMLFGGVLTILITLLYSYHLVFVNGALRANLTVLEGILVEQLDSDAGWRGDFEFRGPVQAKYMLPDQKLYDVQRELNDYVSFARSQGSDETRVVTHSNGLIQALPYAFAYKEAAGEFHLLIDLKRSEWLFHSARIQFYTFANAATLFWVGMAMLLWVWHQRAFARRRQNQ